MKIHAEVEHAVPIELPVQELVVGLRVEVEILTTQAMPLGRADVMGRRAFVFYPWPPLPLASRATIRAGGVNRMARSINALRLHLARSACSWCIVPTSPRARAYGPPTRSIEQPIAQRGHAGMVTKARSPADLGLGEDVAMAYHRRAIRKAAGDFASLSHRRLPPSSRPS